MRTKHAYLILAHNKFEHLFILMNLLDDERNDIYIHIDKKSEKPSGLELICKKANVVVIPDRLNVQWGTDSQVRAELNLLSESIKSYHSYYHLLSGVDLPLKSQDDIHTIFSDKLSKENIQFIGFDWSKDFSDRIKYFHLPKWLYLKRGLNKRTLFHLFYQKTISILNYANLYIQRRLRINRLRKFNIEIVAKGSQWFSITHEFAEFLVKKHKLIDDLVKHSDCSDEIFVQTMLINSEFYNERYLSYKINSNFRYIDWSRGGPYTFCNSDCDELLNSGSVFARKFDIDLDKDIINKIVQFIIESSTGNKKELKNK